MVTVVAAIVHSLKLLIGQISQILKSLRSGNNYNIANLKHRSKTNLYFFFIY